jgi:hypothetical protein
LIEQEFGILYRLGGRGIQPIKVIDIRDLHSPETEEKLGEVAASDFRSVALRSKLIVFFRI